LTNIPFHAKIITGIKRTYSRPFVGLLQAMIILAKGSLAALLLVGTEAGFFAKLLQILKL
jgi:hypothetical protein